MRQRELSIVLKDLGAEKVYYTRVQAYNAEGVGPLSETKSFSLRRGGKRPGLKGTVFAVGASRARQICVVRKGHGITPASRALLLIPFSGFRLLRSTAGPISALRQQVPRRLCAGAPPLFGQIF